MSNEFEKTLENVKPLQPGDPEWEEVFGDITLQDLNTKENVKKLVKATENLKVRLKNEFGDWKEENQDAESPRSKVRKTLKSQYDDVHLDPLFEMIETSVFSSLQGAEPGELLHVADRLRLIASHLDYMGEFEVEDQIKNMEVEDDSDQMIEYFQGLRIQLEKYKKLADFLVNYHPEIEVPGFRGVPKDFGKTRIRSKYLVTKHFEWSVPEWELYDVLLHTSKFFVKYVLPNMGERALSLEVDDFIAVIEKTNPNWKDANERTEFQFLGTTFIIEMVSEDLDE